jgi:molecular chaperone GrpE
VRVLRQELDKLRSESKSLKEQYLRSLAEFDNFRRRKEKEFSDFREIANERVLQDLVQVLDNFRRAMVSTESVQTTGLDQVQLAAQIDGLKKGIHLIYQQVIDTLAAHGLKEYSCAGEEFDPRRAEAVGFVETAEHTENTVVSETALGYLYRDRVLRPAMVVVARKPKTAEKGTAGTKESEVEGAGSEDAE